MAEAITAKGNPWKGLNFYVEGEVLYGRSKEIESLAQYILNNSQTVLYGKSGIGKSSILNAGIFPIARQNGLQPVGIRLDHTAQTPYFVQIRDAILKNNLVVHEVLPAIDPDHETLWEYLHRNVFYDQSGLRVQLLLVFDQFEEIFTLQQNEKLKVAFFEELADLLNDITPLYIVNANKTSQADNAEQQEVTDNLEDFDIDIELDDDKAQTSAPSYLPKVDYHIVFTLREDFLSYLERYTAYIPVMKSNRYALLPINEEQAADIIMQPRKGLIDIDVAEQIIQKVTGRNDFTLDGVPEIEVDAAVLSLYLSRLYTKKDEHDEKITSALVNQFSKDIIKDFYEESVDDLPVDIVEKIEDELITYDGRRNNVSRFDLKRAGVPEKIIDTLVYDKKLLRQFSYQGDIRVEFMHDILCPVVDARISQRELARQQEEERQRQEQEREQLMEQQRAELARIEQESLKSKRRMRRMLAASLVLIVLGLLAFTGFYYAFEKEYSTYYSSFERRNGWPVGVGELSKSQLEHTPLYYRLSHRGYGRKDCDVEVCTSNGRLPLKPRIASLEVSEADADSVARSFVSLLSQVREIHFEAGEKGLINKEIVKGKNNTVLYYVNYFHLDNDGQAWAQYVTPRGQAMKLRSNGLDRVRLSWSTDNDLNQGRILSVTFFDALGVRQQGANGVNGYLMRYSDDGQTTLCYQLDEYGRIAQTGYNVTITRLDDSTIDTQYAHVESVSDTLFRPQEGPHGYWREVRTGNTMELYKPGGEQPVAKCLYTTDRFGNVLQKKIEGLCMPSLPAIVNYQYAEDTGYLASEEKLNADGTPFPSKDGIYMRSWAYTPESDETSMERTVGTANDVISLGMGVSIIFSYCESVSFMFNPSGFLMLGDEKAKVHSRHQSFN